MSDDLLPWRRRGDALKPTVAADRPTAAVVVPVYHNAESLPLLHRRLVALEETAGVWLKIVYVDDASRDDSLAVLERLAAGDARVRLVRLARNHGSFTAIRAGLDHVDDVDLAAVISADLQDPPEHLAAMIDAWRDGADVVLATRRRRFDSLAVRCTSGLFYGLLRRVALPAMPVGGFDFFLLDAAPLHVLREHREQRTYLPGLITTLGFRRAELPYDRGLRPFGRSMWNWTGRLNLAVDALLVFAPGSTRALAVVGVVWTLLALALGTATTLAAGATPAVLLTTLAAVGAGLQLIATAAVGEYAARALHEGRGRPLYTVAVKPNLARRNLGRPTARAS
ncbi:MAG: glycosyltransferase family 2 protein [Planctomycetia bacterium]